MPPALLYDNKPIFKSNFLVTLISKTAYAVDTNKGMKGINYRLD